MRPDQHARSRKDCYLWLPALEQARLSERNVVELVSKLQELGFLGPDLLHSINGREYLTPERLRAEILQAVEQTGGRIALVSHSASLKSARA